MPRRARPQPQSGLRRIVPFIDSVLMGFGFIASVLAILRAALFIVKLFGALHSVDSVLLMIGLETPLDTVIENVDSYLLGLLNSVFSSPPE